MEKIHILVVEDEMILAEDIAMRLTDMGYEVAAFVPTVREALAVLQTAKIDLVMIDIVLEGNQDGIELARVINQTYQIPFIFLTSQADNYFVERAKSVNPAAYMLKPFNDRAIRIAIEMALANYESRTQEKPQNEEQDTDALCIKDSLFLKQDSLFKRVHVNDILWIAAESNYTLIHTKLGKFMYAVLLHKIEQKLPAQFLRVHRSYIVNMYNVTGYIKNILYIDKKDIPVSKRYTEQVFKWFNTL